MNRLLKRGVTVMLPLLCSFPSAFADPINESCPADDGGGWLHIPSRLSCAWHDATRPDIYLPVITWHNRYMYNDEHIGRYNERPWGAGYGISYYDEADNWHGFYAMVFKDSFNKWEPIAGYAREYRWRPAADQHFSLGAGYTVGITARENWDYIPVPIVLPLASVNYRKLSFQATYIPGGRNNGNVFFGWFRLAV